MSAGTHEVWARMAWAVIALGPEIDAPVARLLDGVPYDEAELRKRRRVAWDHYCTIIENLSAAAGGPDELADLVAGSYHQVLPELRVFAGSLVSPRLLYRFVVDVIDPIVFPPVQFEYDELGDDRVRLTQHLRPGARPCADFFIGSTGGLKALPRNLGLAEAEVLAADLGPDHSVLELRLPPSKTLIGRARRLVTRIVLGAEPDGTLVTATVATPEAAEPAAARLDHAVTAWKLSPRQAAVLALVAAGKANKEIAHALACADNTVEQHITRLLSKAGVTSRSQLIARFWSEPWGFPL